MSSATLDEYAAPIVTQGLTKVYPGGITAVDGVDLEVRPGEIFGLLGPNGAGKTTTIGMLTTRVVPTGGRALVDGIDVRAHPAGVKARIGVVPQTNTLDRSISVEENLYYHGRYFGLGASGARSRTRALLERFRLADRARARVDTLSGGMAQRLMVARAILHAPAVLFLDEPTTGLDPQSRINLWDLLRDFHAEGQTILLTTHYMEEADQLCDRLAIMDHGRLLALGSPKELKRSVDADAMLELSVRLKADPKGGSVDPPATPHAEAFARRARDVRGVSHTDVQDHVVRVFAPTADGLLPPLLAQAEAAGCEITDLSVSEPTLESVFIALTGRDLRE